MTEIYSDHKRNYNASWSILVLIIALGCFLRSYHLTQPSLWHAEMCTMIRVEGPLIGIVKRLVHSPFPPFYYIMMNIWVKIFGISEFSLRFPSLVFSALSILFIFILAKELFNRNVGLISAFLIGISPYSINYGQDAKMYSMLWFFSILSFLYFHRFTRNGKLIDLSWYAFWTLLCIYTLYIGFIFMIIQNILFFSFFYRKDQIKKWVFGQLMIVLLYLPWMPIFLHVAKNGSGIHWIKKNDNYCGYLLWAFRKITGSTVGKASRIQFYIYGFLAISAVMPSIKFRNRPPLLFRLSKNDCLILSWIIIPAVIYFLVDAFIYPILQVRYLGLIHIPLIILFSRGLDRYKLWTKFLILIVLFFTISATNLYPYFRDDLKIDGENHRKIHAELTKRVGDNDLILCGLPNIEFAEYYYPEWHYKDLGIEEFDLASRNALQERVSKGSYDSVFLIYGWKKPDLEDPEGYVLRESYNTLRLGFLWFTKK